MDIKKSFEFFKSLHKNQKYSDGEPYSPHLLRVGLILQNVLIQNKEGTKSEREIITIAGFGHDSLEDTKVSIETLKDRFGNEITRIILGMTNEEGDSHTLNYIKKICSSDEKIRLIKLADICDNLMRIIHRPEDKLFLRNKILPIIEDMHKAVIKTKFSNYSKSSRQLIDLSNLLIKTSHEVLK